MSAADGSSSKCAVTSDARSRPRIPAAAVDVTLLGRFYERFVDHAVEIGRRAVLQVTGETPND